MKPWASGSVELLRHAAQHIECGSPFDNRIAFISVDNAVELMTKTYLGLPKRTRETDGPPRRRLQEASYSFPDLLDLLEEYGADRLEGVDLGDIEWYHRLRNTLYHEGNGITVDAEKVDGYFQIARILFRNLFAEELKTPIKLEPRSVVGNIVHSSSQLEHNLSLLYRQHFPGEDTVRVPVIAAMTRLANKGVIPKDIVGKLEEATAVRNEAVHSAGRIDAKKIKKATEVLRELAELIGGFM